MTSCPFCEIARGNAPATIVYSSPTVMALTPLNPATEGHVLVVPRRHVQDFRELDPDLARDVFDVALQLGRDLTASLQPAGMNLITSAGEAATQTVFHLHVHLVPRWPGDRMGPIWPQGDS